MIDSSTTRQQDENPLLPSALSGPLASRKPVSSIKQWRMLQAVVTHGSFSSAADHLQVSQPAISYTIARMEEQLGMQLLKLEGRKAQLTESGRTLLDRARYLLMEATALEDLAETIRRSGGPQIRLAMENGFPTRTVLPILRQFTLRAPHVHVSLLELPRDELEAGLRARAVELAIATGIPAGFSGAQLLETEYIAVTRPDHALLRLDRELTQADLDREVHVVFDQERQAADEQAGESPRHMRWKLHSLETAEAAVLEGLGFAWLPRQRVENAIRTGRLAPLPLRQGRSRKFRYYLIHALPCARHALSLSEALVQRLAGVS